MPGTAPARNIWPTEMPESAPTMIIGTDGGMIGPTVDEAAVTAAEKSAGYPAFWTDLRNGDMLHVDGDSGCITRC